jgi:ATP-dependent protease ClpP protease subunit
MSFIQKQKQEDVYEDDFRGILPEKQKFITLTATKTHLEVHLRGEFREPSECTEELSILYKLANEYKVAHFYINSPGGSVSLLTELLSIIDQFETSVTVATGMVASAGFSLWCRGDIRVIQQNAFLMSHRESYFAGVDKTINHLDAAEYMERIGSEMMVDVCGDVLTDEEIERSKVRQVYFTANELISRGVAISWKQFVTRTDLKECIEPIEAFSLDGRVFIKENDLVTEVVSMTLGATHYIDDMFYKEDVFEICETPTEVVNLDKDEDGVDDSPEETQPDR